MTATVVATAGHIDHGKTTLLRALTGIDADRLPDEQRRGMTIDVGYAHATFGGYVVDFVDVPGHDRLVGNMLVGAGEVDAAMLVVAADDGPRPQTLEHLELLELLGITSGVAVVTKTDLVDAARAESVAGVVADLLARRGLHGVPVMSVSAATGAGIDALRAVLAGLQPSAARREDGARLAIDRVFSVRGRGAVVTGTLRGGAIRSGDVLELVPAGRAVRVREVQVHGSTVDQAGPGRTALNLASIPAAEIHRGDVVAASGACVASDRLLVALRPPSAPLRPSGRSVPTDRARLRLHLGTDQVDVRVGRAGREAVGLDDGIVTAVLRLDRAVAVAEGDRFVLRDPARGAAGGTVLDAEPAVGVSRRRATAHRIAALAEAVAARVDSTPARLELHGFAAGAVADDVRASVAAAVLSALDAAPDGLALTGARSVAERALRRAVSVPAHAARDAASELVDGLVRDGRVTRVADRIDRPGRATAAPDPGRVAAMDALVASLDRPAPPPLAEAAREAGCSPDDVRRLERDGRIVVAGPNLAWSAEAWTALAGLAVRMAAQAPLSPAALRDATGTSRKYVMALLEDLNRRAILARTDAGHRPGPRVADVGARSSVA